MDASYTAMRDLEWYCSHLYDIDVVDRVEKAARNKILLYEEELEPPLILAQILAAITCTSSQT